MAAFGGFLTQLLHLALVLAAPAGGRADPTMECGIGLGSQLEIGDCLAATEARTVICGHTHLPAVFYARAGREPVAFIPLRNVPAPLSAVHRHVVVVGAVGQPRDGDPAACFALLDTQAREVTMMRVPYDSQDTARKIRAAGLPDWLGLRLQIGR